MFLHNKACAAHTPAPWELYSAHPSEQYVDQIDETGNHRKSIFRIHHDDDIPRSEAEANARLVAVAPNLHAFAQYVDSVAPCQPGDRSSLLEDDETVEIVIAGYALNQLRSVLAKAGQVRRPPLPPDPERRNGRRAQWAAGALSKFQSLTGIDDDTVLYDLLADLMHWCDRHAVIFNDELDRARAHYDAETTPEHSTAMIADAHAPNSKAGVRHGMKQ